ncbi:MAG: VOC family protein [Acetobacteraceae bacterium]
MVSQIPHGYHSVTPYLIVDGAARALDWYRAVFAAREVMRLGQPDGQVGHAEIEIGDSRIMLADEAPAMEAHAPGRYGGSPASIVLYVTDVDAVVKKATDAGATLKTPVEDKFYGDRMGTIRDPFGHTWHVATHIEDVSPEEIERRARSLHQP